MSDAALRWTPEQEQAITARGTNLLVAAAAGSGKTATLVERVIRRLTDPTDPIDIDQFLVVTFTDAAASEMRERIADALQKALVKDPENGRLQRQLALLGRASISTLHSFCMTLIRQYFYRLGLDPSVRVLSEHEALLMRHEVMDDLFARRFEEDADGTFSGLVDRYGGGRDDEGLRQLVLAIYDYVESLPWPEEWLQRALAMFEVPEGAAVEQLPWWPLVQKEIHLQLALAAEALEEAVRLSHLPGGPAAYAELLATEAAQVRQALQAKGFEGLAAAVSSVTFGRLPAVKKDQVDEALQNQVKRLRDKAKETIRDLSEGYFARPAQEWLADLRSLAPYMKTLAGLVSEFAEAFRQAKAAQAAVDFNDLERFALQLLLAPGAKPGKLIPSDVARELRDRYAEILVDEYQDINGVQDAILTLVARDGSDGPPNRFMVGDVKQSIYRFRHADPSLFLAKYRAYRPWSSTRRGEDVSGTGGVTGGDADVGGAESGTPGGGDADEPGGGTAEGRRIVLGANFRSRAGVVDGVNFLFRQIMTPEAAELAYDAEAELKYQADYPALPGEDEDGEGSGPAVEVHLLDRKDPDGQELEGADAGEPAEEEEDAAAAELAEMTALEREARLVGRRIREMVDGTPDAPPLMVWDKKAGGYRRVRYRDIVILMRATRGRVNTYLEVLNQMGIPAHGQTSTGYFAATEVAVILSLLQILDNPRQDIPLAAVLRSPIVGLSAADLARVRLANPVGSFYDALQAFVSQRTAMAEAAAGEAGIRSVAGPAHARESNLGEVLANFLATLERWRTLARRRPLSQVLWQIYQETGYLHYVTGMPGGAQREANLLALYERAREFDQFARQGLFRFLRFIERLQEEQADMGTALAVGEAEDVVRIMSIHKSKGLEFPVVFVTSLGSRFTRQDLDGDLLLDRHLGFGPMLVDPEQRVKYPTLAYRAVREANRRAALAEEMRVLYVALTRARERLVLVGSDRGLAARCRQWGAAVSHKGWPLPDPLLLSAQSYLDWIGPVLMRHRSGAPLRQLAGMGDPDDRQVAGDRSRWRIFVWDAAAQQALLSPAERQEATPLDWVRIGQAEPLDMPYDPKPGEMLRQRFQWRYPHEPVVSRFGKLSVTELKGHFDPGSADLPPERLPNRRTADLERFPRFLQEGRATLTPTQRGTVVHLVLQHLDLTRPLDEADVAAQVGALVERQILTPEQAAAVDCGAIARFFASPLGVRIRQHPEKVRREISFTLAVPAAEVYTDLPPDVAEGEQVIVQGMIDLLLEEADGFVLVDYKTDRRDPEEAARRYAVQIALYRRAVEEILGRPVKEAYLHFLAADRSVPVLTRP